MNGSAGVDVFLVLTGLWAAHALLPALEGAAARCGEGATWRTIRSYYRKRAARLLPEYATTLLLLLLVNHSPSLDPGVLPASTVSWLSVPLQEAACLLLLPVLTQNFPAIHVSRATTEPRYHLSVLPRLIPPQPHLPPELCRLWHLRPGECWERAGRGSVAFWQQCSNSLQRGWWGGG